MCRELEYKLGPGAEPALKTYLSKRKRMPFFANARTVRNAIDLARMGSAIRVFNEKVRRSFPLPPSILTSPLRSSSAHSAPAPACHLCSRPLPWPSEDVALVRRDGRS